jgi:Cof subfamily protein (haloacid dehalogenase superfamily)
MIKLALSDLDNTLIPFGWPNASTFAREAIRTAIGSGMHVGPVSGRVPAAMRWMFAGDTLCYATGAFINGQIIYVDGKVVREQAIDGNLLDEVGQFLRDVEGVALALCDITRVTGISDGAISYVGATAEELTRHGEFFGVDYQVLDRVDRPSYIKTNLRCDLPADEVAQLQQELRARFPELSFVLPMNGGNFIDVLPAGWDKGKAVTFLAEYLGLSLDEVVVFGDSDNDLAMLAAVPNSVTVANAVPEIAAQSRWHIGPADTDAVAHALLDIVDANEQGKLPSFMQ